MYFYKSKTMSSFVTFKAVYWCKLVLNNTCIHLQTMRVLRMEPIANVCVSTHTCKKHFTDINYTKYQPIHSNWNDRVFE